MVHLDTIAKVHNGHRLQRQGTTQIHPKKLPRRCTGFKTMKIWNFKACFGPSWGFQRPYKGDLGVHLHTIGKSIMDISSRGKDPLRSTQKTSQKVYRVQNHGYLPFLALLRPPEAPILSSKWILMFKSRFLHTTSSHFNQNSGWSKYFDLTTLLVHSGISRKYFNRIMKFNLV